MIPGFRLLRRLMFMAFVLGALAIGGSIYVEAEVERRVATAVEDRFELPTKPAVDIRGGFILLNVFRGELPEVEITAEDLTVKKLDLKKLTIVLQGVRFDGSVIGKGTLSVAIDKGTAGAIVDEAAVNDLLEREGEDATVRMVDGGVRVRTERFIAGRRRMVVARGVLRVGNSRLRFTPRSVTVDGKRAPGPIEDRARKEAAFSVRLPALPGDLRVDAVDVGDKTLTLRAELSDERIDLAG